MFNEYIFTLLLIATIIQCGFFLYFFIRVFYIEFTIKSSISIKPRASIIICAQNEAINLSKFLPSILEQDYHDDKGVTLFEVIVINDTSTDRTIDVLTSFQKKYKHLNVVHIKSKASGFLKGKKHALNEGVIIAKHPYLVFTDADCMPSDSRWLQEIIKPFNENKEIVIGYGGYETQVGFLNKFIRFETLHTFLQYASYAFSGKPYMAVGRNLACTKDLFNKTQKHDLWNKLPSGDDDMLIQIAANKRNTAVVGNVYTLSLPKKNWLEWIYQKQRHISTGKNYNTTSRTLLSLYAFSHACSWVSVSYLIFTHYFGTTLFIFSLRCICIWIPLSFLSQKMKEKKLIGWIPLLDFCWLFYNLLLSPYIFFKNKINWK